MANAEITFKHKGNFEKTYEYLNKMRKPVDRVKLEKYAEMGREALNNATPVDSGLTAASWYYEIIEKKDTIIVSYCNSNIQNGVPIAVILQYGHATRNGGWVQGVDYINPAIQPVFNKMVEDIWREVIK